MCNKESFTGGLSPSRVAQFSNLGVRRTAPYHTHYAVQREEGAFRLVSMFTEPGGLRPAANLPHRLDFAAIIRNALASGCVAWGGVAWGEAWQWPIAALHYMFAVPEVAVRP